MTPTPTERAREFWMVQGSGPAMARHPARERAENEAKRLARMHPDVTFYVMRAESAFQSVGVEKVLLERPSFAPDFRMEEFD